MGLSFDVLISAIGGNLGSRARGVHLGGVFLSTHLDSVLILILFLLTAIMSFRVSVSMSCERFVEGVRWSCSQL